MPSKNGSSPNPSRTVAAGSWTTLKFNLPQEPATGFTGDGTLESTTGKGVLEALALVAAGGTGVYNVYLDNFLQVQNPALAYSLDAGAPAGATIDPDTGVFSWTPTAGQGPATYNITVRVTDSGSPSLSATKTFAVTVNAAPVITAQPEDQNVYPGGNATFSVTATGTAPLAYQWRKDGDPISGATASSFTLAECAVVGFGQLLGRGDQCAGFGDQLQCPADGVGGGFAPVHCGAAAGPDPKPGRQRHLRRDGGGVRAAILPMVFERHPAGGRDAEQLHRCRRAAGRCWHVCSGGDQRLWQRHQRSGNPDGYCAAEHCDASRRARR